MVKEKDKKPAKKASKSTKTASKSSKKAQKQQKTNEKPSNLLIQRKRSRGRPKFKVTPKILDKAYDLASRGLNKKEIAYSLGIHYETLRVHESENSAFSVAIQEGRAMAIANVVSVVYEKALDGDMVAAKYVLNNLDPKNWKEKREHTVENRDPVREVTEEEMDNMSVEELESIANSENVVLIKQKKSEA